MFTVRRIRFATVGLALPILACAAEVIEGDPDYDVTQQVQAIEEVVTTASSEEGFTREDLAGFGGGYRWPVQEEPDSSGGDYQGVCGEDWKKCQAAADLVFRTCVNNGTPQATCVENFQGLMYGCDLTYQTCRFPRK